MTTKNDQRPLYYSDYLELDKILTAQHPKSNTQTNSAHEEMLFIIVHQVFELWFKQIIYELDSIIALLKKENIDDSTEEMPQIVQRLHRIIKIIRQMNTQFEVLETMQPLQFLEFRSLLSPASGFQSHQFRLIEAKLGLQMQNRHESSHYKNTEINKGGFSEEDYNEINDAENSLTLLKGLESWLERMPYFNGEYWENYDLIYPKNVVGTNNFISDYYNIYESLQKDARDSSANREEAVENYNKAIGEFKNLFLEKGTDTLSNKALVSALFIMLYRQKPMLRLPFEFMDSLIEIDELLSTWRYRHYLVVKKMIGSKPGTGGTAGAEYLLGALQKNNVFKDLTILATYFMKAERLPILTTRLDYNLSFTNPKPTNI